MKKGVAIGVVVTLVIVILIIVLVIILKLTNNDEVKGLFNGDGKDITFICSEDLYNCESFDNQLDAQDTYEYCKRTLTNETNIDPHHLDSDGDGIACEGLE